MPHIVRIASPALQRMSRRRVNTWLGAAALGGLLPGCDQPLSKPPAAAFKGIDITGAPYGRGFALTDFNGQSRTLADYSGRVVMLYFGFVQCPDVCPTALTRAAAVKQQLGADAAQLQVIFVTVDPERDTPEVLKRYARAHGANPAGWAFLTGTAAQIRDVERRYGIFARKNPGGDVDHTFLTSLIDRDGVLRVQYLGVRFDPDEMLGDLRSLLRETNGR